MANTHIKSVVIVGGGSAGWMSAAALSRMLNPNNVSITLIESDAIGTVGVGEATIPSLIEFNKVLGLDERELMAATNATFKLGIEFCDWGKKGDSYIHPFSLHGANLDGLSFHQYWRRLKEADPDTPDFETYSFSAMAARKNRFTLPSDDPNNMLSRMSYAYQFDASAYAALLRRHSEKRGVKRREGKVTDVKLGAENGFIESLTLEDGSQISGDLFIDCSGFRALLIGKALGVKHTDWSRWLPCSAAVVATSAHTGDIPPYTRATAQKAGWQWRIPLQHRVGNGHVYSPAHMNDDEATQILLDTMDAPPQSDPRILRWTNGHREKIWHKNCVAVGLSAGFLEPLESTGLYLIQSTIIRLLELFPDTGFNPVEIAEFNTLSTTSIAQVRDFIILHYVANQREGEPFWDGLRAMELPDSLTRKLDLFKESGRFFRYEDELFTKTSWLAVMLGQNIVPKRYDPLAQRGDIKDLRESLANMHNAINDGAGQLPSHADFIARYCKAP